MGIPSRTVLCQLCHSLLLAGGAKQAPVPRICPQRAPVCLCTRSSSQTQPTVPLKQPWHYPGIYFPLCASGCDCLSSVLPLRYTTELPPEVWCLNKHSPFLLFLLQRLSCHVGASALPSLEFTPCSCFGFELSVCSLHSLCMRVF